MKKLFSLVIALMMCFSCAAGLAATPSKTTDDFTYVEPVEEELVVLVEFDLDDPNYAEHKKVYEEELAKLAAAESVEAYFGEESKSIFESVLGEPPYNVHEMVPFIIMNHDVLEHGDTLITLNFATPYAKGTKVVVMIGQANETIEWTAYEGTVVEEGRVQTTLDAQMMQAVQNGVAVMAIVSK